MVMACSLQLSWLPAPLVSATERPDHEPTPLPEGTWALTVAVPVIAKSACVHAGLVPSVCELNACTDAVTLATYTEPEFGLSKLPLSACAGPPGNRFVIA